MKADGGEENWTMDRREGHIRPWQIDVDLDVGVDPGGVNIVPGAGMGWYCYQVG